MKFLSRRFVESYHSRLIELFGGTHGIRDEALLESALAQPEATFDGHPLHPDVWLAAAAYGYHLCQNHPFLDGNKRIAAVAIGTFLAINGEDCVFDEVALYLVVCGVAEGAVSKPDLAAWLRENAKSK